MLAVTRSTCLAFALILSGACNSDPVSVSPPNGDYSIVDRSLWPGGTLQVTSGDFARYGDDATLTLGEATVPLERVDDQTLEVAIPADLSGKLVPVLHFASYSYPLDEITVAGFAGARQLPPEAQIEWDAYVTTINGSPTVIGINLSGDLARINLRTGAVGVTPGDFGGSGAHGPGMTLTPGEWLLFGEHGHELWRIDGAPHKIADVPGIEVSRQVAQFGANSYLRTTSTSWSTWARPNQSSPFDMTDLGSGFSEPEGIHLSVAADRAIARVDRVLSGVPVFEMSTGSVAYVSDLHSVQGVDFSADGSRIALVGGKGDGVPGATQNGMPTAEVLQASDGMVIASLALPYNPFAVAFDPAGRWLVVGVSVPVGEGFRPGIMLLDPESLDVIAELPAPASAPVCAGHDFNCYGGVVAVDGDTVRAFSSYNGVRHSWRFGLLPN